MTAGSGEGNCWVTQFSSFNQPDSIVQLQGEAAAAAAREEK